VRRVILQHARQRLAEQFIFFRFVVKIALGELGGPRLDVLQRFLRRALLLRGRLRLRCLLLLLALRRCVARGLLAPVVRDLERRRARDLLLLDLLLQVGEVREQVDAAALRLAAERA
jgi:hypothetical protein